MTPEQLIEELIELWHKSDYYDSVTDFTKLSWREYAEWIEHRTLPKDFLERHG